MQLSSTERFDAKPTIYPILFLISLVHLFNDSMQAVIPAIFPILKNSMHLTYTQIGWIGFAINFTASLLQPVFGWYTDKRPFPYMLPIGMASTCLGMFCLAFAPSYMFVLLAVVLVGIGSAIFHPESSRVSYLAAGNRRGLAQSIFQVGGNTGQALAPLMTYLIFIPLGQRGALWFTLVAGTALVIQLFIARWYQGYLRAHPRPANQEQAAAQTSGIKKALLFAMILLIFLIFVRSWYHAGISTYYQFYLMERYHISLEHAQIYIFLFLLAGAAGTFFGGPLADRFGMKRIIYFSMLGSAPLALLLPYVNASWAYVILLMNGFIVLSSFSVTVVYAQQLFPGKIGMVSGLTVGFAFGMGAVGSVGLGKMIDMAGLSSVMHWIGFLPLLGVLTYFLPDDQKVKEWNQREKQTA
ncbi:MFS transporter [Lihuaxuella thermophila]|uniref:MFS transporter, FSR family, fosmidomycin resistance protein n=1 Tax=Lihuaxuella thermophila TaxID=1173111 RepID=A0A1H8C5X8_9BACL|nr:MFS transporter [Lihuaxuella thermophila]SEM89834.1 MFS transporter, FSR family, fosmidomycin resistance protein [Lihuaxuella thermophila]